MNDEQGKVERHISSWRGIAYKLHEKIVNSIHVWSFEPYSAEDERFLALALAGEVGELCNKIKKKWRDGADFSVRSDEIMEEIADIRIYLELIAKCYHIEGEKLDAAVELKLAQVIERFHRQGRWRDGDYQP